MFLTTESIFLNSCFQFQGLNYEYFIFFEFQLQRHIPKKRTKILFSWNLEFSLFDSNIIKNYQKEANLKCFLMPFFKLLYGIFVLRDQQTRGRQKFAPHNSHACLLLSIRSYEILWAPFFGGSVV